MSFLHIDMPRKVEILPRVRQELTYSTYSYMGADALATPGAGASGTMIFTVLNRINSFPNLKAWGKTVVMLAFEQWFCYRTCSKSLSIS